MRLIRISKGAFIYILQVMNVELWQSLGGRAASNRLDPARQLYYNIRNPRPAIFIDVISNPSTARRGITFLICSFENLGFHG